MWCAAPEWHRDLAVNKSVRRSITDSDALRSTGVPDLKAGTAPVAFWDKTGAREITLHLSRTFCFGLSFASLAKQPAATAVSLSSTWLLDAWEAPGNHCRLDS